MIRKEELLFGGPVQPFRLLLFSRLGDGLSAFHPFCKKRSKLALKSSFAELLQSGEGFEVIWPEPRATGDDRSTSARPTIAGVVAPAAPP